MRARLGFASGLGWFAAGTNAGAKPGATLARFSSSSRSGRCRIISTWVPLSMFTSAPRVKSDVSPAAARPAPIPAIPPATGCPAPNPPMEPTVPPVGMAILATSPAFRPLSPACSMVPSPSSLTVCFLAPGRLFTRPGICTTVPLGKMMAVKCMSSCALPLTRPARATRSTTPCT